MSSRIFLVYRRGMSEIPAFILAEHLQAVGVEMTASLDSPNRPERDFVLLILTPGTLERCVEPNDAMRNVLKDAASRNARMLALTSPRFNPTDQVRYAADLLPNAEPLLLDYAQWQASFNALMQTLRVAAEAPPLRPEQEVQLAAQAHFERALSLPADDLAGKLAAYGQALALHPDFAEAYARRGGAHLANGDLAACLADCETALRLNPNLAEAHHNRAMALSKQEDYATALESYTLVLRFDPRNARAHLNRGVARAHLGDVDGAIEDYTAALALNPNLSEAYFNRSLAHGQRDNFEEAMQDYTRAIALNLNLPQTSDAANLSATISYLERLLRRFPDHPQAETIRHEIYRLRGMADDL
ncbi:MAG: tetratricopeptide repeat protein [Chloroflexi bacterium CFX4]|nr:tetratricopeptide repeat protein [Chloroflexi bacterium CFX4]